MHYFTTTTHRYHHLGRFIERNCTTRHCTWATVPRPWLAWLVSIFAVPTLVGLTPIISIAPLTPIGPHTKSLLIHTFLFASGRLILLRVFTYRDRSRDTLLSQS
eukprot:SAG11_NODE_22882_length_398_cov_3.849498_1_plen_103_part_10